MSNPRRRQRGGKFTIRRMAMTAVLAIAIAMGWLLRGCFGIGLGPGDGDGDPASSSVSTVADMSQSSSIDAAPPPRTSCNMRLSSKGLTLDDKPISIEQALESCKAAKEVDLRVTGAARSGTYEEIQRAFEQAGIRLEVHSSRVK